MRPSVLACISISALAAATTVAGGLATDPAAVARLELEAGLARKPDIYLVLLAPGRKLEVKARGVVLDSVPLRGIEVVARQPAFRRLEPEQLQVPRVLVITHGPGDSAREVIAPTRLIPQPSDDEEEAPEAEPTPGPTPTPIPEVPVSYRAELDNGWDLWICDRLPAQTLVGRFRAAILDGWRRIFGRAPTQRPALTLAMSDDDARRIFHLVGTSRAILVTGDEN
jgi:hypothetical protein